jgi:hypothetical protein
MVGAIIKTTTGETGPHQGMAGMFDRRQAVPAILPEAAESAMPAAMLSQASDVIKTYASRRVVLTSTLLVATQTHQRIGCSSHRESGRGRRLS